MVHKCQSCEYSSKRISNLERHVLSKHSIDIVANEPDTTIDVQTYNCEFCSLTFKDKSNCTRHMRKSCAFNKRPGCVVALNNHRMPSLNMLDLLDRYQTNSLDALIDIINWEYQQPSLQNVHITNIKSSTCSVFNTDGTWSASDKLSTLDVLTSRLLRQWKKDFNSITPVNDGVKAVIRS